MLAPKSLTALPFGTEIRSGLETRSAATANAVAAGRSVLACSLVRLSADIEVVLIGDFIDSIS